MDVQTSSLNGQPSLPASSASVPIFGLSNLPGSLGVGVSSQRNLNFASKTRILTEANLIVTKT